MNHKTLINFIIVLTLVLSSRVVRLSDQPVAFAASKGSSKQTSLKEQLIPGEAEGVYVADAVSLDYIGHIGGSLTALAVAGNYAYVGEGPRLTVLDISAPDTPEVIGRTDFIPDIVLSIAVEGDYAYVADGFSGLRVIDVSNPASPVEVGSYDTWSDARGVAVVGVYVYVADWQGGLRVIDVSDPANPTEIGNYYTPGIFAWNVSVEGEYAYVSDYSSGLRVINVTNPSIPVEVGTLSMPDHAQDVAVSGNYAYVADRESGLRVVDVSDPMNPNEVGAYDTPGYAESVVVGDYAYVADLDGLRVIDVSVPTNPTEVGFNDTPGLAWDVAVGGNYAYVADYYSLRVIGVTDPSNPTEIGFNSTPIVALESAVVGSYAYVVDGPSGFRVVDVSDPTYPSEVGSYTSPGYAQDVAVAGIYAYVVDGYFGGLRVVDVSDTANPSEVGSCYTPSYASAVALSGSYAYVANGPNGLRVIDVSTPTNPHEVGFYDTLDFASEVAVNGAYAYVADYSDGLRVIDVSNPANPVEVGYYDTSDSVQDVAIMGSYAYLADGLGGLRVMDVSDTENLNEVGSYSDLGVFQSVAVTGDYAFVADGSGLRVIDVTIPSSPNEVDFYDTPGGAFNVTMAGGHAYVADGDGGLIILSFTETKDATYANITSDTPDPSQVSQPFTVVFEVTASSGTPSGEVTVTVDGESVSCTVTLASGIGECEISLDQPGTYNLVAAYSGDDHFLPSGDEEQHTVVEEQPVKDGTTTMILSDEPDPSQVGQPFTVTFEVTATSGIPGGMVHVQVAGEAIDCFGTLSSGIGVCAITLNVPGSYTLTATYGGDDYFLPSSAEETHGIVYEPAIRETTTTTILSDEPDPSLVGQPFTLTFEVSAASGTPSGVVTATVAGGLAICSSNLASGTGSCAMTLDAPGLYTLVAEFSGDDSFLPSMDSEQHQVMEPPEPQPSMIYLPCLYRDYCPDFFDDFSDPSSGWDTGENEYVRYEYLNGEYRVLTKNDQYGYLFMAPTCDRENYTVEVDAHWVGPTGASYGIVFGITGDYDQYYTFEVNTDYQEYGLWRFDGYNYHTIVPVTYSWAINYGNTTNHLKVVRYGDQISLYINGVNLGVWIDGNITGNTGAGILSVPYYEEPVSDARFDNFSMIKWVGSTLEMGNEVVIPAPAQDAGKPDPHRKFEPVEND